MSDTRKTAHLAPAFQWRSKIAFRRSQTFQYVFAQADWMEVVEARPRKKTRTLQVNMARPWGHPASEGL
jgi:hypothetical protein